MKRLYEVEGTVQETLKGSVRDPECLYRIQDPNFSIPGQKDPRAGSASKNLSTFNPKIVSISKFSEI
jgi:hypothetical protein